VIIYRYLAYQVLQATLAVAFVISLIILSARFLNYMAEAANGEIESWAILLVLLYRIPEFLELVLPLSLFLGFLLAYGRMYVEYEMIVLKACGLGHWRLVFLSLIPAISMALLVAYISLVLVPLGQLNFSKILVSQYTRSPLELLTPGHFFTTDNGEVIYAETMNSDKTILSGFFSSKIVKNKIETIVAESGSRELDSETGEQFMVLRNGKRYQVEKNKGNVIETYFEIYRFKLKEPDKFKVKNVLESTPTLELLDSKENAEKAELQWRINIAPMALILMFLAIPLSKVNPRQGRFLKLIPAIFIYLTYVGILLTIKNKIASGELDIYPGFFGVHLFYLLLALVMLEWDRLRNGMSSFIKLILSK